MLAQMILKENVVKHVEYLGASLGVHRILVKRRQNAGVVGFATELYFTVQIFGPNYVKNPVHFELK